MTHAQSTAYRLRWLLLTLGLACWVVGAVWVVGFELSWFGVESMGLAGTPAQLLAYTIAWTGADGDWQGWIAGLIYVGLILIAQWAFLRPRSGLRFKLATTGRPMKSAIIAAAAMAMLLTTGAVAMLLEIPDWWTQVTDFRGGDNSEIRMFWIGATMLVLWLIWASVFWAYWRQGDRYTQLGRIIRGLLAGSVLEMFIAAPVHIWVSRERECYCARGSYTGLVFGATVLLWCFGPGIYLLFLREAYRRQGLGDAPCPKCGYDLRGSIAGGQTTCPECGQSIPDDFTLHSISADGMSLPKMNP